MLLYANNFFVENDKKVLMEILSKYKQEVTEHSTSVLEDLKAIVEEYKQREFERVHFHFSGKKYLNEIFFVLI